MNKRFNHLSITGYVRLTSFVERHQVGLFFLFGMILLSHGLLENTLAQGANGITSGYDKEGANKFGHICEKILEMHSEQGSYGSLLTALAGLGAILASAMGGFKAAWSLLVVAIGSFLLNSYRTLFFGSSCGGPFNG